MPLGAGRYDRRPKAGSPARSSARMRRLKAGCVTQRVDAAREKFPACIKAPKSSNHASSITHVPSAAYELVMREGQLTTPRDAHGLIHFAHWSSCPPVGSLRAQTGFIQGRSEDRRVGKEWVSRCRYWWSPYN